MSVYATCDEKPGELLASNRGWGDFVRWASSLKAHDYPLLVQFAEHACTGDVPGLVEELADASAKGLPAVEGLGPTVTDLLSFLQGNDSEDAVFITDGMTEG